MAVLCPEQKRSEPDATCISEAAMRNRRNATVLVVIALGCGGLLAVSAQSDTERAEIVSSEPSKAETPARSNADSLFATDANFAPGGAGSRDLFYRMTLSVLLVIALGAGAIYVSRRLLPRFTHLPSKEIRILETAYLGPRKAVHLVKIGDQRLLIGSTNENITMLTHVSDPFVDLAAQQIDGDTRP